jgi:Zn-dependent protease/predicted transcriptional regulator
MSGSLKLFRIWGIDVQVHWSFLLILVYGAIVYSGGPAGPAAGALYGIIIVLFLFACVVLHELGHAVMAKYFKVNVPYITLLPIGGVAQLERMPRQPAKELLIGIAGPAVNFVLAIILAPIALLVFGLQVQNGNAAATFNSFMAQMETPGITGLLLYLAFTNVILGVFNLLPAFPMDGGRILRALLAMTMPYIQATRIAVLVGRVMAVLFAIWGIVGGGIILLLIAFFVYVGGHGELESVESRFVLKDILAKDALTPTAQVLYTSEKIDKVVNLIMTSYQTDFPVFDLSNQFVGVLTRGRLVGALKTQGPEARVAETMIPAAQIPVVAPTDSLATVWDKMLETHSRVVTVKEGTSFLGLITMEDLTEVIQVMGAAKERTMLQAETPA